MTKRKSRKTGLYLEQITALNDKQKKVLRSSKNMALVGSAGTGKTFLASYIGFNGVMNGLFERVIYFRSAVPTRDIGFLPGTEKEKIDVYTKPYRGICAELFNKGSAYEELDHKRMVSFEATSFVRGTTIRDAVIIVDECQNMTFHELDSVMTRLGDNCRIFFCGDTNQADLTKNGFGQFWHILDKMKEFDTVSFDVDDIVRSDIVKSYLTIKSRYFEG